MRSWITSLGLAAVFVAMALSGGCGLHPHKPAQAPIRPLAPLLAGEERQLSQHIQLQYRGERKDLLAATLLTPQLLKVSLVSPQGVSLLDIQYDGRELSAQQYLPGAEALPAGALLADLQLVYWPLELLRESLPRDWELREVMESGQSRRLLYYRGQLHTQVDYGSGEHWIAEVRLLQKPLNYSLTIKNLR
jgi:hypothetical protein